MKKISILLSMAVLAGTLSGCVVALGNKGEGQQPHLVAERASLGQQLLDLKKARDEGAMTEEEYVNEKNKLLGKRKK